MSPAALPTDLRALPPTLGMKVLALLVGDHYDTFRKKPRLAKWYAKGMPRPLTDDGQPRWDRDMILAWREARSRALGGRVQDLPSPANDPQHHPLQRPAIARAVANQRARLLANMKGASRG